MLPRLSCVGCIRTLYTVYMLYIRHATSPLAVAGIPQGGGNVFFFHSVVRYFREVRKKKHDIFFIDVKPVSACFRHIFFILTIFLSRFFFDFFFGFQHYYIIGASPSVPHCPTDPFLTSSDDATVSCCVVLERFWLPKHMLRVFRFRNKSKLHFALPHHNSQGMGYTGLFGRRAQCVIMVISLFEEKNVEKGRK